MKNTLLTLLLIMFIGIGHSQLLNVRLGGNVTGGITFTTVTVNGFQSDEDTSGVLATMVPVNVDFAPWKFLSFNAGFKTGSWLNEDPNDDDVVIKKKRTSTFLLGLKAYPLMKENFHLYLGYDIGLGGFKTVKETTGIIYISEYQRWSGINQNINLGMNWYFGGALGMFFQVGYSGFNFDLKELTWNNEDQMGPANLEANMKVKGVQFELGFAYKFGQIE